MLTTIGTCSLCGGPVCLPTNWNCVIPAVPTCQRCGAVEATHGPVIPMTKGPLENSPKFKIDVRSGY